MVQIQDAESIFTGEIQLLRSEHKFRPVPLDEITNKPEEYKDKLVKISG